MNWPGRFHGLVLNYEAIARELGLSGDTIKAWFQILDDTLVGSVLPAYPLHMEKNETKHGRFFFFDAGIARAAEGLSDFSEVPERRGFYFEGIILNELKTYCEVNRKKWRFYFYSVPRMGDLDIVIEVRPKTMSKPAQLVTIEVKLAKQWKPSFDKLSLRVNDKCPDKISRSLGVYLGEHRLTRRALDVYPLDEFVENLWSHQLITQG